MMQHKNNEQQRTFKIFIITLSDRAYKGEYEDLSGAELKIDIETFFNANKLELDIEKTVIADDAIQLENQILKCINEHADMIFTCGGTGIGPRDITPETVRPLLDKELTGIMEYIRQKYGQSKPGALLSRSIAGTKGTCQIYCLPGSPKAVKEYIQELTKILLHADRMLHGSSEH